MKNEDLKSKVASQLFFMANAAKHPWISNLHFSFSNLKAPLPPF